MFLAHWDGEICGLMGCLIEEENRESADLFAVWVAPEHRRHGIAVAMLHVAQDWACGTGALFLHAWVAEKNRDALRFYESVGMRDSGRREPLREDSVEEQRLLHMEL